MRPIAPRRGRTHEHTARTFHVLRQRSGVPYEFERTVCSGCRRVLRERALRRTAA